MPMDSTFVEVNRRAIAVAIRPVFRERLVALLAKLDSSDFPSDLYAGESNELVIELSTFDTFFEEVVLQGRKWMLEDATTPQKIEEAYTYFTERGVVFPAAVEEIS